DDAVFFTDPSFFKIFTYRFLAGDRLNSLAKPGTVVLTKSLAEKLFNNAEDAVNKTVYFDNNAPTLVTAVIEDVPENSHFTFDALRAMPENYTGDWANFSIYTYLLVKKDADIPLVRAKMPAFIKKYFTKNRG